MSQPSTQANRIITLNIEPNEPRRLANLCGQRDEHLKLIESRLGAPLRHGDRLGQCLETWLHDLEIIRTVG